MFCEKVKEKLGSSDDYQAFLKCLNIYSNGIIKKNDLQNLVRVKLFEYVFRLKSASQIIFVEASGAHSFFVWSVHNYYKLTDD